MSLAIQIFATSAVGILLLSAPLCAGEKACAEGEVCEADVAAMLQIARHERGAHTDELGLCGDLSNGRLDYLAGGVYDASEVSAVACNMAANIFPNGTILASPSKGTEVIHEYPDGTSINENDYYYMWQRDAGLTMQTLLRVAKDQQDPCAKSPNPAYGVFADPCCESLKGPGCNGQLPVGCAAGGLPQVCRYCFLPGSSLDDGSLPVCKKKKEGCGVRKQLEAYATLMHEIYAKPEVNKNCAPWGAGDGWCSTLGEPKFFPNGSIYDKPWGRNQNDGPAINAMVLMQLLEHLYEEGKDDGVLAKNAKEDVISALNYVGGMGLDSTIDPWEMLYGQHFFVQAVQYRAVAQGAAMAERHGWDDVSNFALWVPMLQFLGRQHWIPEQGVVVETNARPWYTAVGPKCTSSSEPGANESTPRIKPCELDVATLIGSLSSRAGHGPPSTPEQVIAPHDSRMLATAYQVVTSIASTFEVNQIDDEAGLAGVLIGRYPGDEYSGVIMNPSNATPVCSGYNCGSAWFLATHTLAELIYATAEAAEVLFAETDMEKIGAEEPFLLMAMDLALPKAKRGKQTIPDSPQKLARKLIAGGDGVLARAKHHAGPGMHMSEQIYRGNDMLPGVKPGTMIGARDLTWSYASLLDALATRAEAVTAMAHMPNKL